MPGKNLAKRMMLPFALVVLCQSQAFADPKPANTVPANPTQIKAIFAEKSWRWKNEHGGAYHARDGRLVAILGKAEVVGSGRWSVSANGTLCHVATWNWKREYLKQRKVKDCWKHVVDKTGQLWQHDRRHGWYKFPDNQISNGDKFSRRVNLLKKKIGL